MRKYCAGKDEKRTTPIQVTTATDIFGEWGPWQRKIIIFFTYLYVISPIQNLGILFYAPKIKYWCEKDDDFDNITIENECKKYSNSNENCERWEYDISNYDSTIISEWNLVCQRSWLVSASTSVFQIGIAIAALVFGVLSDRYGRLKSLKISIIIEIIAGFSQSFSISIEMFLVSRFFLGFASYGRYLTGYLLIMESVGISYRALATVYIECGWITGYLLLPGIVYIIPNFRYIQLVASSIEITASLCLWKIPESPRWQLTHGQIEAAEAAIKNAAVINGKFTEEEIEHKIEKLKEFVNSEDRVKDTKNQSLIGMWKIPRLLKYSVVLYITWFVNSFLYYGISLNVGDLGGNLYLSCFVYAVAELLSNFFLYFAFQKSGRRTLFFSLLLGVAISCFGVIPFLYDDSMTVYRIVIAMFGKFCITSTYHLIYLLTSEIMPTTVRQVGVGSCSVAARFGSVIAPFVKELSEATHISVSMGVFGTSAIVSALLSLMLPETKSKDIPDTVNEVGKLEDFTPKNFEINENRTETDDTVFPEVNANPKI